MEFRKMAMITLYARQQKTQMYRTVFWTLWERERVGWFERMASKHVYHIRNQSLVQVQCRIQDAWGWCTGMTQRDGMGGRWEGGFSLGNTCTPVADSCWCMAKPIQHKRCTYMYYAEQLALFTLSASSDHFCSLFYCSLCVCMCVKAYFAFLKTIFI